MDFGLSGDALIAKADEIAEQAHRGQTDKLGQPYIHHPRRVAGRVSTPEAKAAALLHDVIEADNSDPARLSRVAEPKQSQLRAKYRKTFAALGRDDLAQTL